MKMTKIDAAQARALYPQVKGEIRGADLWSGFAILDMGPGAYGVMVAGKFVACCPDYSHAKKAGEKAANAAIDDDRRPAAGRKVRALRMGCDSFYQQVIGQVTEVRNGFVRIDATLIIDRWSKSNQFEPHPSSCSTSAKVADVEIIS